MKDSIDILAWLLAAEDHPHLREKPSYVEAEQALRNSPELQALFAKQKAFIAAHPVLTQIEGLPEESRARIEGVLRNALKKMPAGKLQTLSPWGIRKNFAWAALLALLLAGMSVISSNIIHQRDRLENARLAALRNMPPQEAFYNFIGELMDHRLPLQHRENGSTQLVSWLEDRGAKSFETPERLVNQNTMGCAYLDSPCGKVSLICFNTEQGTVHLFVIAAKNLSLKDKSSPSKLLVNDRQALKWNDEENAYLLITHKKDQNLPEVFL